MCIGAGQVEERMDIAEAMADDLGLAEDSFIMALVWAKAERKPRVKETKMNTEKTLKDMISW